MSGPNIELNWAELNKLTAEVIADDGPGSSAWNGDTSHTKRLNEALMESLRANGGTVPGELGDVPMLIVTTTGAKSGEPRPVPLAYQVVEGRVLVIASMGGAKRNPPWFHNLRANPTVVVERDGETYSATAVITEGADRTHLFEQICANFPVFADYQKRTERTIPVIELVR